MRDCIDDENRSVARYAVKSTELLKKNLTLQDMLTDYQRKEAMVLEYINGKRRFFMGNFWGKR